VGAGRATGFETVIILVRRVVHSQTTNAFTGQVLVLVGSVVMVPALLLHHGCRVLLKKRRAVVSRCW
jgi:hypothetical protein